MHICNVQVPYKMKYWWRVNFGDSLLLDKIANIYSTNNNLFFISGYSCKMALLQCLNHKFPYHQSWFHYQSASFNKWMTIYIKTEGDKVSTSGIGKKWCHQCYENSAKERVDIGKYYAEITAFPSISTTQLVKHVNMSCKFKHI